MQKKNKTLIKKIKKAREQVVCTKCDCYILNFKYIPCQGKQAESLCEECYNTYRKNNIYLIEGVKQNLLQSDPKIFSEFSIILTQKIQIDSSSLQKTAENSLHLEFLKAQSILEQALKKTDLKIDLKLERTLGKDKFEKLKQHKEKLQRLNFHWKDILIYLLKIQQCKEEQGLQNNQSNLLKTL